MEEQRQGEGQGPFRCNQCGRAFNSQNELREHERTHETAGQQQVGRTEEEEKKKGVGR